MSDYIDNAPYLVQKFLDYKLTIQNRSKLTVFQYYHDLRTFFRFILKTRFADKYSDVDYDEIPFSDAADEIVKSVTSEEIYNFISYATKSRDNNASSRSRKLSCLRSFYKYLTVTLKVVKEDPTTKIESPKKPKTLPKFLSLDQSMKLLTSVDGKNSERDFAIITLFLNCGLRVSELAGINISDMNSDKTTLNVTGKGSKERMLYLNDACRSAIDDYLKVRPGDIKPKDRDALFISRNRNRISVKTVQWLIYKRLRESGLENLHMSVHKLRHTAATLMYKYGNTDVRVLKDILGHEELSTTQIYTHLSSDQLKTAADKNPLANIKTKIHNKISKKDEND